MEKFRRQPEMLLLYDCFDMHHSEWWVPNKLLEWHGEHSAGEPQRFVAMCVREEIAALGPHYILVQSQ
jgi:hypothetical protein